MISQEQNYNKYGKNVTIERFSTNYQRVFDIEVKLRARNFIKKVVRLKYLDSASFLLVRDFLCERFILFSLILYIFKNTEAVVLGFYPLKYSNSTFHQRKHENKKVHKIMSTRNILGLLVL